MEVSKKRIQQNELRILPLSKRQKIEQNGPGDLIKIKKDDIPRTSDLSSPILQLSGHKAEVYTARFSPNGRHIVTASRDKLIFLWDVFGECENYMVIKGHKNAVLQADWTSDNEYIVSCSADKTLGLWDANTGKRIINYRSHEMIVNSFSLGRTTATYVSVSDDGTCRLWDRCKKNSISMIEQNFPLTAVAYNDEKNLIFTGGLDNSIYAWDIRKPSSQLYNLNSHIGTISSLSLDPEGVFLLSNAYDNFVNIWDIRPFVAERSPRKCIFGSIHGHDRGLIRANWNFDSSLVGAGSFDCKVCIWDSFTGEWKYHLPGHKAAVNDVSFHPTQPIIASASSDFTIFMGEIQRDDF